jgi:hypothetical protein
MVDDGKLAHLQAEIHARERDIHDDAERIVRLLEEDFPAYLRREVKARFLAAPDLGDAMASDTITRLKRDIETEGREAALDIARSLRDSTLWLVDVGEGENMPSELRDMPEVWQRVARIDAVLEGLLRKYGFPVGGTGGQPTEYRPPTWFGAGALLKTLLETYRAHAADRSRLLRALEMLERDRRRAALDLKWEAAD